MNTTGEQLRRVNQVASAILALVILVVLAGILWVSSLEGKPQAPGQQTPTPGVLPTAGQEGRPEIPPMVPPGHEGSSPGDPNLTANPPETMQAIPAPPPGQLDYLPPDAVSSPEPRSERAGEFNT